LIERMEVKVQTPDDSLTGLNPDPPPFPIVAEVAFKDGPSIAYRMPDPRVSADWHKPGFFD
jgi:hypothetical protein